MIFDLKYFPANLIETTSLINAIRWIIRRADSLLGNPPQLRQGVSALRIDWLFVRQLSCAPYRTSFVFTLAYKHGLNPPQQTTLQIAATLINNLQPAERKRLQVDLFG